MTDNVCFTCWFVRGVCVCVRRLCCFELLWHLIPSDNAAMAIMMLIAVTTHANEPRLNNYKNDLWCRFVFPSSPSWTSDKRHFWERSSRGVFFFFFPLLPGSLVLFTMISHSLLQCYLNESQHLCVLLSIKITGGMSGERPESVVADRLQRARIQTSDACQVCLESVNCQIFHILQVTDSSQCFQRRKIWQMEMFSVARQRIKGPSHSHFNCFFFVCLFFLFRRIKSAKYVIDYHRAAKSC